MQDVPIQFAQCRSCNNIRWLSVHALVAFGNTCRWCGDTTYKPIRFFGPIKRLQCFGWLIWEYSRTEPWSFFVRPRTIFKLVTGGLFAPVARGTK